MDGRVLKQFIIGLVFVLVFGLIGYGIYSSLATKASCVDGVKNGKEEGLDCGTLACGKSCEPNIMPLNIISSQLLKVGQNDYDFVAQISNPNTSYGASRIEYLIDSFGYRGFTYILPGQSKWIVVTTLKNTQEINEPKLAIKNVQWEKIDMPDNVVGFSLRRRDYRPIQVGTQFDGILYNDSNYDFDRIDVAVILFSNDGDIVGVGKTDIRTFVSKTERGFSVVWPFNLSDEAVRENVEASTNLFENSNFIKSYGSQEKFQKFY